MQEAIVRLRTVISVLAVVVASGCSSPESPLNDNPFSREGLAQGLNATVVWMDLEGGFWALRTDDGRTLDPHETLPADFRVNNLRVRVSSTALDNVVCFHMVGLIVSVTSIQRL
jgi:hypothetical protein